MQSSEVYTNAVAAQTITFAADAAATLGLPPIPGQWLAKAAAPHLPLTTKLPESNGAAIHPEYEGYEGGPADCCSVHPASADAKPSADDAGAGGDPRAGSGAGCCIMQSAAALLQYPLGLPMPVGVMRNDLLYYEPRTRKDGFFTGDSIYSIAWLALGDPVAALTQWESAFAHMDCTHFCLFREELTGGHSNFITGAGGFLQNIIQGWAGVRIGADAMTLTNPTLPPSTTAIKLQSLEYCGSAFSVEFNASAIAFAMVREAAPGVTGLAVSGSGGIRHDLRLGAPPVRFSLAPQATFQLVAIQKNGDGYPPTEVFNRTSGEVFGLSPNGGVLAS